MMTTKYGEALATLTDLRMQANLAYATYRANCSCGFGSRNHGDRRGDPAACPWYAAWRTACEPVDDYEARVSRAFSFSDAYALKVTAEARAYAEYPTNDREDV